MATPITDETIISKARELKENGVDDAKIREFVTLAKASQAQQSVSTPAATEAPPAAPAPRPVVTGTTPEELSMFEGEIGGRLTTSPAQARQAASYMTKAAPFAAAAFAPVTLPGLGATAAVAGGAKLLDRFITGEKGQEGDVAKEMIQWAVPMAKAKEAPILAWQTLKNLGKGAVAAGGTITAGEVVQRAIETGSPVPYDSLKEAFSETWLPTAIGAATLGLSGRLIKNSAVLEEVADQKRALEGVGFKNPQLGDVLVRDQPLMLKVASQDPMLRAKIAESRGPVAKNLYLLIGKQPLNEELATSINKIIPKIDEAEAELNMALRQSMEAEAKVASLEKNLMLPPETVGKLKAQARADQLNLIGKQAKANIKEMVAAESVRSMTGRAEALSGVVEQAFKVRSNIAGDLMAKTGIDSSAAIFDKGQMLKAARTAMGNRAEREFGQDILESIREAGKKLEDGTSSSLSLSEFRDLRMSLADKFSKKFESEPNALREAQSLAKEVYGALGDSIKPTINAAYGPESLAKYDEFLKFWKQTSELVHNPIGGPILKRRVTDETIQGLANKVVEGKWDEVRDFREFVSILGSYDKNIADHAMATLTGSVRESLLKKASDAKGVINYAALGDSLTKFGSIREMKAGKGPFKLEDLRFGDLKTVSTWSKVLSEFQPHQLSPDDTDAVMSSPVVQDLLVKNAKNLGENIRKLAAGRAFEKRTSDAYMLLEAGEKKLAQKAFDEANQLVKMAKISEGEAIKRAIAIRDNPLYSPFKGKGGQQLTNVPEKYTDAGTISDLVMNMKQNEGKAWFNALRENDTNLAEMAENRLIANELMRHFSTDQTTIGSTLRGDVRSLVNVVKPPIDVMGADTRWEKLKAILGPDKMEPVADFIKNLNRMEEASRLAAVKAGIGNTAESVGGTFVGLTEGSMMRAYAYQKLFGTIHKWYDKGYYNIASAALLDKGLANALYKTGGDVGAALNELPLSKAYLLMRDPKFSSDVGKAMREGQDGNQQPMGKPTSQFKSGQIYKDKNGIRRKYLDGRWLSPEESTTLPA